MDQTGVPEDDLSSSNAVPDTSPLKTEANLIRFFFLFNPVLCYIANKPQRVKNIYTEISSIFVKYTLTVEVSVFVLENGHHIMSL